MGRCSGFKVDRKGGDTGTCHQLGPGYLQRWAGSPSAKGLKGSRPSCVTEGRAQLPWEEGKADSSSGKAKDKANRWNSRASGINWLKAVFPEEPNKSGQGCLGSQEKFKLSPGYLLNFLVPAALILLERCSSLIPCQARFLIHSFSSLWCFMKLMAGAGLQGHSCYR